MGNIVPKRKGKSTEESSKEAVVVADRKSSRVSGTSNDALIFIKPHAANAKVRELVEEFLKSRGIQVQRTGEMDGAFIDENKIIDKHYAHIAKIAMEGDAMTLAVSADKKDEFKAKFGSSWDDLANQGKIISMKAYKELTGKSYQEIENLWRATSAFKLGPGTYVGFFADGDRYVLNPFYGVMRSIYTVPEAKVIYYVVQWPEDKVSWKAFRADLIGATDPTKAPAESLRGRILSSWKELGLASEPNTGNNGVHASAGPMEGLRERMTWCSAKLDQDPFGKRLIEAGVQSKLIDQWLANERVKIGSNQGNAFDLLEDINSAQVIKLALEAGSKL